MSILMKEKKSKHDQGKKLFTDPIRNDELHWMTVCVCLHSHRRDINHRIVVLLMDKYSNRVEENM